MVCRNLRKLCKDKKPEEQVLDTLTVRTSPHPPPPSLCPCCRPGTPHPIVARSRSV
jgi:hypothetical protein